MFTKLAADVTFSDLEDFCRESGEGIRVEYKRDFDIKKHIPKTVSAFANTQGGIFIIGAETDKKTNKVIAIDGIPNSGGIEEQIQQSALTGIYPAVIPEVINCGVPANPNNVVVIVRVDESPQAPHAIQNSTKVYIRVGSITQPYELKLAEVDQIEYMLKRREDSQITTRQILERIEERIESSLEINPPDLDRNSAYLDTSLPNLTVIARPVFPYRPIISTRDIYDFTESNIFCRGYRSLVSRSRVAGGLFTQTSAIMDGVSYTYRELNEYGIVYQRFVLHKIPNHWGPNKDEYLIPDPFVRKIGELIHLAHTFYEKCEYSGHIEVTAQLRRIFGEELMFGQDQHPIDIKQQQSFDSEISASTQYLPRALVKREQLIEIVDELVGQLLWAFNIDDPTQRRGLIERFYSRS